MADQNSNRKVSSKINLRPPHVYWLTGLSGSGKSTLAKGLDSWLRKIGQKPLILDGDDIRNLLLEQTGYDRESRLKIAGFNSKLCKFIALQNQTVICSTISLFSEIQKWNRENIPGYIEIFLDVSMDILRDRDTNGLYSAFEKGKIKNVVGLDIRAEFPEYPDIHLKISEKMPPAECAEKLQGAIEKLLGYG